MLSRRPGRQIKALLFLFPLDTSPFNEAQRRRRPRLFSEALLKAIGVFGPFFTSDHGLRGNPFAHRAIMR